MKRNFLVLVLTSPEKSRIVGVKVECGSVDQVTTPRKLGCRFRL